MRPQLLIAVRDVEASSRWYQRLLDCKRAHDPYGYVVVLASAHGDVD